jgi:hypothetical protein
LHVPDWNDADVLKPAVRGGRDAAPRC